MRAAAATPVATLLVIVAHPDDESLACGALLARCSALGVRVVVVSLSRGEAGPSPTADAETGDGAVPLAARRTAELRAAAAVLGVADVVLRDYEDGMLPWVEPAILGADLDALLQTYRPDAVITFGADGLYWHPDHIAVHERVTEAVARLGPSAPALYYVTMPPGQMRAVVDHAGGRAAVPGLTDPEAFGAEAAPPTLVIDAGPFAARKLAALLAHHSQFGDSAFARLSAEDAGRLLAVEHLHRASVGASGPTFLDALGAAPPPARSDVPVA